MAVEVRSVVSRLSLACGIMGFSQISPTASNDPFYEFKVAKWRVIYTILTIICVYLPMIPLSICFYEADFEDIVTDMSQAYWMIMSPCGGVLAASLSLWHRRMLTDIVNVIITSADTLKKLTDVPPTAPALVLRFSVILTLFYVTSEASNYLAGDAYDIFMEYAHSIVLFFVTLQFSCYVLIINSLLIDLNKGLIKYFQSLFIKGTSENYFETISTNLTLKNIRKNYGIGIGGIANYNYTDTDQLNIEKKMIRTIRQYRIVHHNLYEAAQNLNGVFATVSVWLVSHMTIMIIITGYSIVYCIKTLIATHVLDLAESILVDCHWALFVFITLCFFIYPCAQAKLQSEALTRTVNQYLALSHGSAIGEELHKFSTILTHEKFSLSPHDLFVLSNGLTLTITSSAITYLVLLTQIQVSIPPPTNSTNTT